jgi:hypothetical protein
MAEQLHAKDSLSRFKSAMNSAGHLQLLRYPFSHSISYREQANAPGTHGLGRAWAHYSR